MSRIGVWSRILAFGTTSLIAATLIVAAPPKSSTFDANGVKIHYLASGTGEPVVLIHGLDSSAEINWNLNGVIGELAKDHEVVAFDMPGHGQSDKPKDPSAYGRRIVDDLGLLMDHLKIEKAHIVGYSLGGMVALKFVVTHPERTISCTLGGMGWLREGSPLQAFWERMPGRQGARTPSAFTHAVGQLAVTEADLKKVSVPVRVLVGARDPVKRMYVLPLEKVRSDWKVVEIPDAGHLSCIMKPQFRTEIADWVRQNGQQQK